MACSDRHGFRERLGLFLIYFCLFCLFCFLIILRHLLLKYGILYALYSFDTFAPIRGKFQILQSLLKAPYKTSPVDLHLAKTCNSVQSFWQLSNLIKTRNFVNVRCRILLLEIGFIIRQNSFSQTSKHDFKGL